MPFPSTVTGCALFLTFLESMVAACVIYGVSLLIYPSSSATISLFPMLVSLSLYTLSDFVFSKNRRVTGKVTLAFAIPPLLFFLSFNGVLGTTKPVFLFSFLALYYTLFSLCFSYYTIFKKVLISSFDFYVPLKGASHHICEIARQCVNDSRMFLTSLFLLETVSLVMTSIMRRIVRPLLSAIFYSLSSCKGVSFFYMIFVIMFLKLISMVFLLAVVILDSLKTYNISFFSLLFEREGDDKSDYRLFIHRICYRYVEKSAEKSKVVLNTDTLERVRAAVDAECRRMRDIVKEAQEVCESLDRSIYVSIPMVSKNATRKVFSYRIHQILKARVSYFFWMFILRARYSESKLFIDRIRVFLIELARREGYRSILDSFTQQLEDTKRKYRSVIDELFPEFMSVS